MMLIVYIVIIFLLLWIAWIFNSFIRLRIMVRSATADIEVQLKRRADLIPNLVRIVQTYAKHEKTIFTRVAKFRAEIISSSNLSNKLNSNQDLTASLKSLLAIAENYPELRANTNFLDLQKELTDTENKIEYARRFYNGAVRDYNTKIEIFPYNLLAGLFHFRSEPFFDSKLDEN